MPVIDNSKVKVHKVPGMTTQTLANRDTGVRTVEVWRQTMAPGGMTPLHRHDCEEVILIQRGSGTVTIDGASLAFGPDSTLILPPNAVHQLINTGTEEVVLLAMLGMGPVVLESPKGERIHRPWLTS
jgi:mannose-6-phosphate isomerase-like protein (cupin superfamily)